MLAIPSPGGLIKYVEWSEEADPYATLLSALSQSFPGEQPKIFVDNNIRKFIVDGLQRASETDTTFSTNCSSCFTDATDATHFKPLTLQVFSAPVEITRLRERKSEHELRILKCANEVSIFF